MLCIHDRIQQDDNWAGAIFEPVQLPSSVSMMSVSPANLARCLEALAQCVDFDHMDILWPVDLFAAQAHPKHPLSLQQATVQDGSLRGALPSARRVTLRFYERLVGQGQTTHATRQWNNRWSNLSEQELCAPMPDMSADLLQGHLRVHQGGLRLGFIPMEPIVFEQILLLGIPVAAWPCCEQAQCDMEHILTDPVMQWPQATQQHHSRAGSNIALLWDSPRQNTMLRAQFSFVSLS